MTKSNMHSKNNVRVNLLMQSLRRDNQHTLIFYILVWSEVALEIDFFEKTDFLELTNT